MKAKNLIVMMLIGVLSVGMFVGCDDGSSGGGDNTPPPAAKVVEEKYRGYWNYDGDMYFTLSENTWIRDNTTIKAFTEGNKLYLVYNTVIEEEGTFTSDTTFVHKDSDIIFTKEP